MRILLLSDTAINSNGGGISQTLYNLFSFIDPQDFLFVTSSKGSKPLPASEPFASRSIIYDFEIISIRGNRFSKYINPFILWFNYSWNEQARHFKKIKEEIKNFNPDIVISCPNGPVGVFMHAKLLKGLSAKIFPYFMDDWMYEVRLKWIGGEIHKNVKEMLTGSNSWLMISNELSEILEQRYAVKPKTLLVVHNPVNLSDAPNVELLKKKKDAYTLVYAGALWPMHSDSFFTFAKSVNKLKENREINLVLYTSETFWNWRKRELEPLNVIYGGSIPYKDIHQKISDADALILVSSFLTKFYSHSKGSIQTKITDYLKAKRLIISCGPNYSANHNFLNKHNCGVCIESNDINIVTDKLNEILDNIVEYQKMVLNGWSLLEKEFTFSTVHQKLISFLSQPD